MPKEQSKLEEIRAAIKKAVPDATETTSYFEMPGYSYEGYNYNCMFAWFRLQKSYILYLRPPAIQSHKKKLEGYATTKAMVRFPLDKKLPISLVKKIVRASVKIMKDRSNKTMKLVCS